ncbi:MAG: hypothetical protein ACM30G_17000, partial [Micromonosporaceae bacterium]
QAARDNREAVRDLVGVYQDLVIQTAEAGKSTDGLDRQLEDTLVQMGFNRAEAHKYVAALGLIPDSVTTQVKLEAQSALLKAQETARELHRMLAGAVTVRVSTRDPMAGGHAHGGIIGAESGGWTMVGERGPEPVRLPLGSTVYPNGTPVPGGGGGVSELLVRVMPGGAGEFEAFMARWIKRYVLFEGGGSVQTAFGAAGR